MRATPEVLRAAQAALQAGDPRAAEAMLRDVLAREPSQPTALHLLGLALAKGARRAEGIGLIERSIAAAPTNAKFLKNFAVLLAYSDRPDEPRRALDVAREALRLTPADEELRRLIQHAAERCGMSRPIVADWLTACEPAQPTNADGWLARAVALDNIGELEPASRAYRRALELEPANGSAARKFALFLVRLRVVYSQTIPALRRGIELTEDGAELEELRAALATQLAGAGDVASGERELCGLTDPASLDRVEPATVAKRLRALAGILQMSARADEAAALFDRASALDPTDLVGAMQRLFNGLYLPPPDEPEALLAMHRAFERQFIDPSSVQPLPPRPIRSAGGRRLRVGYVSGDFKDSSVGRFLLPLLEAQARGGRVEIHCFSTQEQTDDWTPRFQAAASGWHPVHDVHDDVIAASVRALEIDVLIDLAGFTMGTRILSFARRAAPLQLTYLGYPSTTGLSCFDGRITDAIADPPGVSDAWHSERLLRLPGSFGLFAPPEHAPPVAPSPALLEGRVTFASVSYAAKVNDAVLDAWAAALRAAPSSTRLLLINAAYADAGIRQQFIERFGSRKIGASRIEFVGRLPFHDYLQAHARIDLILDTFPFNGHTTTVQNLWMGVPVLTIAGKSHRARLGASVLSSIGLSQLIARDADDFAERAGRLAARPAQLADLRATLRARMQRSPLMDADGFARAFDQLLLDEWERLVDRQANAEATP